MLADRLKWRHRSFLAWGCYHTIICHGLSRYCRPYFNKRQISAFFLGVRFVTFMDLVPFGVQCRLHTLPQPCYNLAPYTRENLSFSQPLMGLASSASVSSRFEPPFSSPLPRSAPCSIPRAVCSGHLAKCPEMMMNPWRAMDSLQRPFSQMSRRLHGVPVLVVAPQAIPMHSVGNAGYFGGG